MAHIWIGLERDADGYPPYAQEQLHVEQLGEDLVELSSTPVFAPGLAVGDVLRTRAASDGESWATDVVRQGDHWCSRVVPLNGYPAERAVEVFNSMGCAAHKTQFGLVTVDVAVHVEAGHVLNELRAGRDDGDWDFDLGVDPEL